MKIEESVSDIVREMREKAEWYYDCFLNDPNNKWSGDEIAERLSSLADRIESAM